MTDRRDDGTTETRIVTVALVHSTLECRIEREGVCRSCGARILWTLTPRGNPMPVDPPQDGTETISHFATCPDARRWRTGRGREKGYWTSDPSHNLRPRRSSKEV